MRRSGHATGCAIRRLLHHVAYHRCRCAPRDIPIASYHDSAKWRVLKSSNITKAIRESIQHIGPIVGLSPSNASTRSLRASGAMPMLLGGVNGDVIRILGCWKSDTMRRYLQFLQCR